MHKRLMMAALAAVALVLPLAGCIKADPAKVPQAATSVMATLRERSYGGMYESASKPFKNTFTKADFTSKMAELEGFGQLIDFTQNGEPAMSEEKGDKLAWVTFTAKFALAEGPFKIKLRGNDVSGEWQLDGYDYDISGTTTDPPYPPNSDGAEKLARRFMYLWQNRRYGDISKTMKLQEDPKKVEDFMQKLEKAGKLLTLSRTSYQESTVKGLPATSMEYDMKFDNGNGTIQFELVSVDREWRIDTVKYNITYNTTGPNVPPASNTGTK